ncbi:MAG: Holliday junction resolvase RuvX [Pseudomonadales bacterium]|nr:Holliday junction resolvase RuvX [Pseudomonadales bacterium]
MPEDLVLNTKALTLLAFDYGTQKIGVAVGQSITGTASPLPVLAARDGIPDWQLIETLIKQWRPDAFVVGLPLNMDGSDSAMTARARKFCQRLSGRFSLPCHGIDERLSSREAREQSRNDAAMQGKKHDPRSQIDSLAARLILETWFAENSGACKKAGVPRARTASVDSS